MTELSATDCLLLNSIQQDFPLESRPFMRIAERVGISEQTTIRRLQELEAEGAISRFGAVFRPNVAGASTLVALSVPEQLIERTAAAISALRGVNHNYLREHEFNLWFVLTGPDRQMIDNTLAAIRRKFDFPMLDLPMEASYHIDLGFAI